MHVVIMVFESNSHSKSDYKYARSLMQKYFRIERFKFEKIYAGSKSELYSAGTERKIKSIFKKYQLRNTTYTILFFADVDTNNIEDALLNERLIAFANKYKKMSQIVWCNYDIEYVFLGYRVEKNKPKEAENFLKNQNIQKVNVDILKESNPFLKKPSSNMYLVLSSIFPKK